MAYEGFLKEALSNNYLMPAKAGIFVFGMSNLPRFS